MNADAVLAAVGALLAASGVAMVVAAWRGASLGSESGPGSRWVGRVRRWPAPTAPGAPWWARRGARWGAAAAVVAGVWLGTGWPLAALLAGLITGGLPWLLTPGGDARAQIVRLEALEEWVRRLTDVYAAGTSLEEAVLASVRTAPAPIAPLVQQLVARLGAQWDPVDAYRAFADALDDGQADKVVSLMIRQAATRGGGLSAALRQLADSIAETVVMRRRVEADRAKARANARWVTVICLVVFAGSLLAPGYFRPYLTAAGQAWMALLVGLFVAVLLWMRHMAATPPEPRYLGRREPRRLARNEGEVRR